MYDLKVLADKLKGRGLDVAEDAAQAVCEEVFAWIKESAAASPNPYDDMVVGLLGPVEVYIKSKLDAIDGKKG